MPWPKVARAYFYPDLQGQLIGAADVVHVITTKDNYIARFSNLHGYHVVNTRTGTRKFEGTASLDEATRLAAELMRNRPRQ